MRRFEGFRKCWVAEDWVRGVRFQMVMELYRRLKRRGTNGDCEHENGENGGVRIPHRHRSNSNTLAETFTLNKLVPHNDPHLPA